MTRDAVRNAAKDAELRRLALSVTRGDLRRPWSVQTSNSFRRIGTDRGDGDVLCAVTQRSDGQPDLRAAPDVLDYIVAVHPYEILRLLEERDAARHALHLLRHEIVGHDEAFQEARGISGVYLGGVTKVKKSGTARGIRARLLLSQGRIQPLGSKTQQTLIAQLDSELGVAAHRAPDPERASGAGAGSGEISEVDPRLRKLVVELAPAGARAGAGAGAGAAPDAAQPDRADPLDEESAGDA